MNTQPASNAEMKHTPTPWTMEPHPADRTLLIFGPLPTQRLIAELSQQTRLGGVECAANADLIVQAVNSHARLLSQNEAMRQALEAEASEHEEQAKLFNSIHDPENAEYHAKLGKKSRTALSFPAAETERRGK